MIFLGRIAKSTRKCRSRDQETIADTSLRRRCCHINTQPILHNKTVHRTVMTKIKGCIENIKPIRRYLYIYTQSLTSGIRNRFPPVRGITV